MGQEPGIPDPESHPARRPGAPRHGGSRRGITRVRHRRAGSHAREAPDGGRLSHRTVHARRRQGTRHVEDECIFAAQRPRRPGARARADARRLHARTPRRRGSRPVPRHRATRRTGARVRTHAPFTAHRRRRRRKRCPRNRTIAHPTRDEAEATMSVASQASRFWRRCNGWRLAVALLVVIATAWLGPLGEQTARESAFAACILGGSILLLVIAANLKFRYLSTPLLAPDLVYYFNAEIADTLLRYPFIIGAIAVTIILVPLLLVLLWRGDTRIASRSRGKRALGIVAAIAFLAVILYPRGPFAQVYEKGVWEAMIDKSFVSDFIVSIPNAHVSEPRFRPADATRDNWRDLVETGTNTARRPDIIAVLEESTF